MNPLHNFGSVQKAKFFSQKEVELLSGLTRNQLRKLDDIELVVPAKNPGILYSWSQLIFLRVLFRFSEDWSFKVLTDYFKLFSYKDLEKLLNTLDKSTSALLILENDDDIYFQLLGEITLEDNDLVNQKLKKAIENIKNGEKLDFDDAFEIIKYIAYDALGEKSSSKIGFKKQTLLIIPEIIQEITSLALELEIKDFDLKVG